MGKELLLCDRCCEIIETPKFYKVSMYQDGILERSLEVGECCIAGEIEEIVGETRDIYNVTIHKRPNPTY